jgi:hypothetical protein
VSPRMPELRGQPFDDFEASLIKVGQTESLPADQSGPFTTTGPLRSSDVATVRSQPRFAS